ncbi:hypothetical protein COLO4_35347 [Corchorus olitorius]|uniref:Uncharacterized protein n=1 Tax=Corchorus olitorius TaxID=93759 RepID=A0A1R3GH97_9ROSI|nr:hypothetical protein COLO4_35347 [Corchorus olitorius]
MDRKKNKSVKSLGHASNTLQIDQVSTVKVAATEEMREGGASAGRDPGFESVSRGIATTVDAASSSLPFCLNATPPPPYPRSSVSFTENDLQMLRIFLGRTRDEAFDLCRPPLDRPGSQVPTGLSRAKQSLTTHLMSFSPSNQGPNGPIAYMSSPALKTKRL